MSYSEKLNDPRWQRKRLEILKRDGFTCQNCERTRIALQIHYRIYLTDYDPWDYPNEYLVTLCEGCREYEISTAHEHQRNSIERLLLAGLFNENILVLCYDLAKSLKFFSLVDMQCLLFSMHYDAEFRHKILSEIMTVLLTNTLVL